MKPNRENRRYFLLGSLAAAAATSARPQDAADTISVGLIGTGNRGSYLLKMILEQPGVRVAALCDIKPDRLDRAATAAAEHKPKTFQDYRKLLDQKALDAIYIATPCDLHVEMAIAALQAGKHVYCEKPAGITPDSIGRLVRVVKRSKTVFQIGQQRRSEARLKETMQEIHDGAAGRVILVKAQRHSSRDLPHDGPSADWLFFVKRSGDILVEQSVHNLDLCNWAIDAHPLRAVGMGGVQKYVNQPPGRDMMDGYSLIYEYPGGVTLSYTQLFYHPREMPGGGQQCYIYGINGAVDLANAYYYPEVSEPGNRPRALAEAREPDRQAHIKAFFNAVRGQGPNPAGIEIAATAALTAILGREAIYKKKAMRWSDLGVTL